MFLKFLLFAAMFAALSADYPDDDNEDCHVEGMSDNCKEQLKVGLDSDEMDFILDWHNKMRNKIAMGEAEGGNPGPQPPAANMRLLTWNQKMADRAQLWADQCDYRHDHCRNIVGYPCGQNLDISGTNDSSPIDHQQSLEELMQAWYDEVNLFSNQGIDNFVFQEPTAHYTQLAWADTSEVGCGYICWQKAEWKYCYLACNYSPPGNVKTESMYEQGEPASDCPDSTSPDSDYEGLCS